MTNETTKKWSDKYITLCAVVTWLSMFGPLMSYFVAFHIMGMSAFDRTIDLGVFHDIIDPLVWPAILGGLAAPFVGVVTGFLCLLTMKAKWKVYFPFGINLLFCLFVIWPLVPYEVQWMFIHWYSAF